MSHRFNLQSCEEAKKERKDRGREGREGEGRGWDGRGREEEEMLFQFMLGNKTLPGLEHKLEKLCLVSTSFAGELPHLEL